MYKFNIFAIPLFITALNILILGLFVLIRNKNSVKHRSLAIFCLGIVIWQTTTALGYLSASKELAIFWAKLSYSGIAFISPAFYHFSLSYVHPIKQKKFLLTFYLCAIFFVFFSQSDLFIKGISRYYWGYYEQAGDFYPPFMVFFATAYVMALVNLFKALKISPDGLERSRRKLLLVASFIATLGMFDFIPVYIGGLYPVGFIPILVFVSITVYAVVRHSFMDIHLIVVRSAAYSLTVLIIAVIYVSIFYQGIVNLDQIKAIDPFILNILALLTLAFSFEPLRRFISKYTDKLFSKGRYDFNELLGRIGAITKKNSRSITGLTNRVMETLTQEMRINGAAFILMNSPVPTQIRTLGFKSRNKHLWNKPVKIATDQSETIVYDELPEDSNDREILRKIGAEVLIPIKTEQETEAVLALGPKNSGDMYTAQDLNLLELVAPQIAIALENAKSFKEKEQRITELKSINKMFQHIEHFLDLDNLMQKIVDEVIMVTGAEGGSVMLLDKTGKNLTIKTARNLHPLISLNTKIKVGEGIAGTVAKTHKPLILNGLRDKRFKPHLKREDVVSAISVPMKAGDKLIGVLNVNRKKLRIEFSEENVNVMTAFAAQAAEAIVKAGYYHQIEKLSIKNDNQFKEFTKALAKTVDAKDPYTYGHSEAVTNYALEIAKEMGVSQSQMRILEIGGRLHDIGKIGVAEHILNKPAGLTDEEYKQIQRHPEIGARILQNTSSLKSIRDLILYHHERFDGRGYPTNLRGKEIPLLARILAVADTFDAMTSHRAYRKALSRKMAVDEIMKCSGSQFDPDIVKAFLRVLDKKRFRVIKNTMHQEAFVAKVQGLNLKPTAE